MLGSNSNLRETEMQRVNTCSHSSLKKSSKSILATTSRSTVTSSSKRTWAKRVSQLVNLSSTTILSWESLDNHTVNRAYTSTKYKTDYIDWWTYNMKITLKGWRRPKQIWTRRRWPSETLCIRHCKSISSNSINFSRLIGSAPSTGPQEGKKCDI